MFQPAFLGFYGQPKHVVVVLEDERETVETRGWGRRTAVLPTIKVSNPVTLPLFEETSRVQCRAWYCAPFERTVRQFLYVSSDRSSFSS